MTTWNCRKDCQYLSPDGCSVDDKMPNPKGDLSFELEDPQYPTCWMYMKPLGIKVKPATEQEVREQIKKILETVDIGCTSGGDYRLCNPYCESPTQVADQILSLIQPLVEQARTDCKKELIEELGLRGATLKLESKDDKPVAMFNDGDFFEQKGELISFLMHLSVMMPTWDTDTELIIIPKQALQH